MGLLSAGAQAAGQPMFFSHIGMLQGLSQNTVMTVLQDSQGFIWLGTEGGLDRWDGYSVKHYRRGVRGNGLANDFIWAVAEDASGDLWLATDGGGLARWHRRTDRFDTWRHVSTDPLSLASDKLRSLVIAPDGRIWIGTNGSGLDLFDPHTGRFRHFRHQPGDPRSLPNDAVYALHLDREKQLWIGTDGGLSRLDPGSRDLRTWRHDDNLASSLCGNEVRDILERANGEFWVGTFGQGLCRFDAARQGFVTYRHDPKSNTSLSDSDVRVLFEDDQQRFWIGTANGLNLFDERNARFQHANYDGSADGLSDGDVMALYQDRGGVMWVGTRSGGVNAWNPRSWSLGHFRPSWSQGTNITSFATTPGSTWIGTMGRGLVRQFDDDRKPATLYVSAVAGNAAGNVVGNVAERKTAVTVLPDNRVMSLLAEGDGSVWVGTMVGGLMHLRPDAPARSEHFRHDASKPGSLCGDGVMALFKDQRGNLWVGTFGAGVCYRPAGERDFQRVKLASADATQANATAIVEDHQGGIWIGTDRGLDLFNPATGKAYQFRHTPDDTGSLGANSVYALHVDAGGTVWVGTAGGGLNRVLGSSRAPAEIRFATVSQALGLASDVVYGIESDTEGALWLSGNNGLSRYWPGTGDVQTFHRSHGLQAEEFNFGAHYREPHREPHRIPHREPDARLWFGGANGYNAFAPAQLQRNVRPPQVVLTRFEKFDRLATTQTPYPLLRNAHLAAGESMFTFEFAALDFTAPGKNRYQYYLEGFDAGWIDAGQRHRATYTNLDPGHYRFHVKAANSEGVWSVSDLTLDVDVDPPLWRTPRAYMLYAAVAALLGLLLFRALQARRNAKQAYLEKLEAQVQARTFELNERNQELRQLADAKGEFVARMSHELRTPITGVLGMVELLLRTALDLKQARLANTIKRSAGSLLNIINDILDFSKVEAQRVVLEQMPIDLEALADESVESLAVLAQRKGLEIVCDAPSGGLPMLIGDPLRLTQILANLLGNALKFTDQGHVVLRICVAAENDSSMTLHIEVIDTGAGIRPDNLEKIFESFTQEDSTTSRRFGGTGLGLAITRQLVELMGGSIDVRSTPDAGSTFRVVLTMQKAAVAKVMTSLPGVPVPAARNEPLLGSRVLLVGAAGILRGIVARHLTHAGAQVSSAASADIALGSANEIDVAVFVAPVGEQETQLIAELAIRLRHDPVLLAVLEADTNTEVNFVRTLFRPVSRRALIEALRHQLGGAATYVSANESDEGQLSGCVLVVDDNVVNQEVAKGMLELLGIAATVVGSGEEAVACFSTAAFDLVLMDCGLPGMSGYQATAAIRSLPNVTPSLPILAFTAGNTMAEHQRCLDAGMNDVLAKPCLLQDLRSALLRWLPVVMETVAEPDAATLFPSPREAAVPVAQGARR